MKIKKIFLDNYILITILSFGAALRFYHLDFQSIWLDEILTMRESNPALSMKEFQDTILLREGMSYFYFGIIRIFHLIFGYSTYTARMFSVLIGVASLYMVSLLGKLMFNKNTGLFAALLLCVNLFAISYSQEARPYMLLVFSISFSFYRLILFIKQPNIKNAIYYGFATALIVNTHFVGLSTIFSQYLLLFFVFLITQNHQKLNFFKFGFISFLTAFILSWNTKKVFMKALEYKSGWLTLPGPDGFTNIFKEFLGSTELLSFVFMLLLVFYFINIFKENDIKLDATTITNNQLLFSGIIFFTWFFIPVLLPIIKSYLSEPMILPRYFIGLLPALTIVLAISINAINNKVLKIMILLIITSFSLVDIVLIKDYYNKITKTQFREVSKIVAKRNLNKDKIVSSYGWLMTYFFSDDPKSDLTIESNLAAHVDLMRKDQVVLKSFWYMDGNSLPYNLTADDEQFLKEKFDVDQSIEQLDVWAKHYKLKTTAHNQKKNINKLSLSSFEPFTKDNEGNLMFFENSQVSANNLSFDKGTYELYISGNSLPAEKINGENAHLTVKLNDVQIGSLNLNENKNNKENKISFTIDENQQSKINIIFDNDVEVNKKDRNAIIYSIKIKKITP